MKKILDIAFVLIFALTICCVLGCGANNEEAEVAGVVTTYIEKMKAGEFSKSYLKTVLTRELYDKEYGRMSAKEFAELNEFGKEHLADIVFTIDAIKIVGDTAYVTVIDFDRGLLNGKKETSIAIYKNINGTWRLSEEPRKVSSDNLDR